FFFGQALTARQLFRWHDKESRERHRFYHGSRQVSPEAFGDTSCRLLEQLPPDQHAPDFARTRPDLVELGVAQEPAGRIVVDIPVAAEQLDRVERDLRRLLGGIKDGAGRVL